MSAPPPLVFPNFFTKMGIIWYPPKYESQKHIQTGRIEPIFTMYVQFLLYFTNINLILVYLQVIDGYSVIVMSSFGVSVERNMHGIFLLHQKVVWANTTIAVYMGINRCVFYNQFIFITFDCYRIVKRCFGHIYGLSTSQPIVCTNRHIIWVSNDTCANIDTKPIQKHDSMGQYFINSYLNINTTTHSGWLLSFCIIWLIFMLLHMYI